MSYNQAERALIYKLRKDWNAYVASLPSESSPVPVGRWLEIQADCAVTSDE